MPAFAPPPSGPPSRPPSGKCGRICLVVSAAVLIICGVACAVAAMSATTLIDKAFVSTCAAMQDVAGCVGGPCEDLCDSKFKERNAAEQASDEVRAYPIIYTNCKRLISDMVCTNNGLCTVYPLINYDHEIRSSMLCCTAIMRVDTQHVCLQRSRIYVLHNLGQNVKRRLLEGMRWRCGCL